MIKGIFVTATGTDVGKTLVAAGLMRHLRCRGTDCAIMKPVQTGAARDQEGRLAPDVETVLKAAGTDEDESSRTLATSYLYKPACSPHLAASLAGETISLPSILAQATKLAAGHERLIVEGAGGVMVPLNQTQTMLDLMVLLKMPAVLVGLSGLGTINHVLLSLAALRSRGVEVLGVVLNDREAAPAEEEYIRRDNVRTIEAYGKTPVLARIPYLGSPVDLLRLDASLSGLKGLAL